MISLLNRVRQVFYPYSYLDTTDLDQFWFLYVQETVASESYKGRLEKLSALLEDGSEKPTKVRHSFSAYAPAIEGALRHLALCRWRSEHSRSNFSRLWHARGCEPPRHVYQGLSGRGNRKRDAGRPFIS
jgi:hypothetical protein